MPHSSDIQERAFGVALRILKVLRALPRDNAGLVVARQLARSGTSSGANTEEARAAHGKAEFTGRMNIARAEARETLYWLRLLVASGMIRESRLRDLIAESEQLVRILTGDRQTCPRTVMESPRMDVETFSMNGTLLLTSDF